MFKEPREMLADLLTNGDLSHYREMAKILSNTLANTLDICKASKKDAAVSKEAAMNRIKELQVRLDDIIALETPHANSTVRKMVKIAKGE